MKVVLARNAIVDIAEAADWYQAKREGLGDEFLEKVGVALDSIGANSLAYHKVSGENRRCPVDRFPYSLFFKIEGDAIVVACLHSARNPQLIKERSAGVIEMRPKNKPTP